MKIIRIDTYSPDSRPQKTALMADSAIRPDRRPLFLPTDQQWKCEIRPAIRINRLGKSIAKKFASRYYSEWTIVNYLCPQSQSDRIFPDMTDDTVVHGVWQPINELPATLTFDEDSCDLGIDTDQVGCFIQALSTDTTFKTGDIIILPQILFTYSPTLNESINIKINKECSDILHFSIK